MRNALLVLVLACPPGFAAGQAADKPAAPRFVQYDMGRFSCQVPGAWEASRDRDGEARRKIYELELLGPRAENAPVMIYASYYAQGNTDFKTYSGFIERNSRDAVGRTKTPTRKYSPVKETKLNGGKAFSFERDVKEFLDPEGDSEETVAVREKFYVLPGKDGFFVLHYYAPVSAFAKNLPLFSKMAETCKVK
jgi:hypothetical protein